MPIERIAFAAAVIGALALQAEAQLPNGACSTQDAACSIEGDNLLGVISGVATTADCRRECEEFIPSVPTPTPTPPSPTSTVSTSTVSPSDSTCGYFTHYGSESYPFTGRSN